ncbi:hypothetical protein BJF96_g279 [Verticillium dahliae]|uniref:Uncharacterized protein n=1 Tax=Verticillium dahliae TaxID=27337 RepID=A0AA44WUF6_VERDA|nr:hypothetical protein BJF96_g279 [Verticillium dahliae]
MVTCMAGSVWEREHYLTGAKPAHWPCQLRMSYQLAFGNLPHSRQTSKHPTSPIDQASPGASRYHEDA